MNKKDIKIRWTRGQGNGGQHRQKTENCCVMTHVPSGITVTIDGRSRYHNEKEARKVLKRRLEEARLNELAKRRKAKRDAKLKDNTRVRTYDYTKGIVIDHRTGKKASLKDVLEKGQLDKLK